MSRPTILVAVLVLIVLVVFTVLVFHDSLAPLIAIGTVIGLIAGGNLLYGSNSHLSLIHI